MNNKDVKFSYYTGRIKAPNCIGHADLHSFIRAHKDPKPAFIRLFDEIKTADALGDYKLKRQLKQQLFSFTPSVLIQVGLARKYSNISKWTGLMQLDFDKIETIEEAVELKNTIFNSYDSIVTTYLSPSGKGVKALMKTTVPKDKAHFKRLHKAVSTEMEQYSYFDEATNNAVLPLFLSIDKDILYRDISECTTWDKEESTDVDYKQLNDAPPPNFKHHYNEDFKEKTIRIFKNKIRNIYDNGHPQLRSACLILGSRVGAGYITEEEAYSLAREEVGFSVYLAKGIDGYISTSRWCIQEGIKNPKYYKL